MQIVVNIKSSSSFIKFDIADFYPSISRDLLLKTTNFAKSITPIQDKFMETILHSRKALLFNKNGVWVKKDNPDFDVTMDSYDGTEVCELVGLYMLDILTKEFVQDKIGLYRDDGLGCFQNLSGPESEKVKEKLCKIFKERGLSITVECNLQVRDFLDVTFDLRSDKYYPCRKDNNQPLSINKQSNHPQTITKQIPLMVSRRISDISCNKEYFDKAAPAYNNALKLSGFNETIEFTSTPPPRRKPNRKMIWFNPPYSVNVKTNIGRILLRLIDKHFPRHHKYRKLFNRNNIKINYSCMPNMASVIRNHNTNLLKDPTPTDIKECSCRRKPECPLDKKCLSEYLVHNASFDRLDTNETKHYDGTYEKNFKERSNNHTASFGNKSKEKSTELSKYIWELKDNNIQHNLKWCIASKSRPYVCGNRMRKLCLTEKLTIIKADPESLINTRDELVSKCRHTNKFTLKCFKKN